MHKATFLGYRPSQIASTALLVAIDLNKAEKVGSLTQRASGIQIESFDSMTRTASDSGISETPRAGNKARDHFKSMLLGDYELRKQQSTTSISPPSNYATESP